MPGTGTAQREFVLGLVAPDLLASEFERLGDVRLRDVLAAGLKDGPAKRKACLPDALPRSRIGVSRFEDVAHRVRHLPIVTCMLATVTMLHHCMPHT